MKILQRIHPILLVISAMISVQWGAALAKSLFAEFGAITVVFWRVALAAIMLLIIVRPALRALSRQQWQTFTSARREAARLWNDMVLRHQRIRRLNCQWPSKRRWEQWAKRRYPMLHSQSVQQIIRTHLKIKWANV